MVKDVYSNPNKHPSVREVYNDIKKGTYKEIIEQISEYFGQTVHIVSE
jgi:hypothetical protein